MALHGFGRHLRWSDFPKVAVSRDGEHDASTSTQINADCRYATYPNGKWKIKHVSVALTFNAKESWVVEGKQTKHLLTHEQMHYNIAAIAARQLEKELAHLKGDQSDPPEDAIQAVVSRLVGDTSQISSSGKLQQVQKRYDEDLQCGSNHGLDRHHQIVWEHRIIRAYSSKKAGLEQLDSCPREPRAKSAAAGE